MTEAHAPHVEEEQLHRYFDGELQAGEAASVRGHLASCDHCTARHEGLKGLRRLITVAAEQSTLDVDFDRAFARIEREVRARPKEQSLVDRIVGWLEETLQTRPERLWAPALGVAAAAAVLYAVTRSDAPEMAKNPPPPSVEPAPMEPSPQPTPEEGAQGLPPDALAMASSELVQVDFGTQGGTVFEIDGANGRSTPVVWINE